MSLFSPTCCNGELLIRLIYKQTKSLMFSIVIQSLYEQFAQLCCCTVGKQQLAVRFFSFQIFSCQIFGWNCFDCPTFYCLISMLSDHRLSDFCHVRFFGRQIVWLFKFLLPDFPDETEHAGPTQCKAVQVTESVICEIWCRIRLL